MSESPAKVGARPADEQPSGEPVKAYIAENAVDDTEDMPEDDCREAARTSSYDRRHHNNRAPGRLNRAQELVPFPFLPNIRPLTISDLESCVALENAAFADPAHRCTREKFEYRLSACPELCLGLFCTVVPEQAGDFEIDTLAPAHPVESGRGNGAKSVLMAHIVATRSYGDVVTDAAMDYPRDFRENKRNTTSVGHQEAGPTVCLHSFAVHPKLQGCGLGKLIMKAYLQQLKYAECAERCSLICKDYLVSFYERFGFKHLGPSRASFGGGGWHDMTLLIADVPPYPGRQSRRSK